MTKITPARKRVLKEIIYMGGSASPYDLGYPRSHMMHELLMGRLVSVAGPTNSWHEPSSSDGGVYYITEAGRKAVS